MKKRPHREDSSAYLKKKAFFEAAITIYGRKPVLEALQDEGLTIHRLHLSDSNKPAKILDEIVRTAKRRGVEIRSHSKKALSRISKNGKQDQGVAADLIPANYHTPESFLKRAPGDFRLIALDGIKTPQNLGMIIRSVCAGYMDGILLPSTGSAQLGPLVIKASAGTLFKTTIIRCKSLETALAAFKGAGASVCTLSSHARRSLFDHRATGPVIYVLGNETDGVSDPVSALSDHALSIPMNNGVESLNVAVTASLIAFLAPRPH